MNLNALRRNYDKLTVRERFAAIVAADFRGDDDEVRALNETAPKGTYRIPRHSFLSEAFLSLTMLHRCAQLEKAGLLLMVHAFDDERGEQVMEHFKALANQFMRDDEAWRQICAEFGVDPVGMLAALPGDGLVDLAGDFVEILADEPDPVAVGEVVQSWRKLITDLAGPVE